MSERELHCWEQGPDSHSTCMLLDGHEGPHEFTPDSDIELAFADTEDETRIDLGGGMVVPLRELLDDDE